jgi:hypothetical protein
MRFVLHYRGPLKSNGNPLHKHDLRETFHLQLKQLWAHPPLDEESKRLLVYPRQIPGNYSLPRPFGPFIFVPLVTSEMHVVAELSIVLLRPEAPGKLITQGGDIDNRVKTLFDALTMPRHQNALPPNAMPTSEQTPFFFCLLEDDNLVTSVSVKTEQLLEPVTDLSVVEVYIEINTKVTRLTMGNGNFG